MTMVGSSGYEHERLIAMRTSLLPKMDWNTFLIIKVLSPMLLLLLHTNLKYVCFIDSLYYQQESYSNVISLNSAHSKS